MNGPKKRFTHHPPPDDGVAGMHQNIRLDIGGVAQLLDDLLPDSREKSLALTKLEEAMFWANAGLARNGPRD